MKYVDNIEQLINRVYKLVKRYPEGITKKKITEELQLNSRAQVQIPLSFLIHNRYVFKREGERKQFYYFCNEQLKTDNLLRLCIEQYKAH